MALELDPEDPHPLAHYTFFWMSLSANGGGHRGGTDLGHIRLRDLANIIDNGAHVSRCILQEAPSITTVKYIWFLDLAEMFSTCTILISGSSST